MDNLLDGRHKSWYYNNGGGTMNEKKIEEILQDPNTWEWDGCTYSELNIKENWEDAFLENLKEQST